jgi:hypothetical protein
MYVLELPFYVMIIKMLICVIIDLISEDIFCFI